MRDHPRRVCCSLPRVAEESHDEGIRDKISRQGEEALGRLAEELAGNPLVTGAISRAFEARERAVQAQEAAMGVLGIPSAADIERLTRRLRSVSQRLEGIEDSVDGVDQRLAEIKGGIDRLDGRLEAIAARASEAEGGELSGVADRLDEVARDLAALRASVAPGQEPPPRAQERLSVTES
jgi:CRP-like cAMP-binding protein